MNWTPQDDAVLKQLWADGHSTAEIGRRMNRSKNSIVGRSHRLELDARPDPINRPARAHPKKDAIEALLRQGISPQRVANRLRVGTKIVSRIRDGAGIPLVRPECRPTRAPKAVTIPRLPSQERPMLVQDVRQVAFRVVEGPPPAAVVVPMPTPSRGCEWLDGTRRNYIRCGEPAVRPGCSWCHTHFATVYTRRPMAEAGD